MTETNEENTINPCTVIQRQGLGGQLFQAGQNAHRLAIQKKQGSPQIGHHEPSDAHALCCRSPFDRLGLARLGSTRFVTDFGLGDPLFYGIRNGEHYLIYLL